MTDINIDDDPADGDDFAEISDYKVNDEDNAYDLSGEQDFDKVVSIFKKLDNQDSVIPAEDGRIQFTDNETGAEYVIDPGTSAPESTEGESLNEEDLSGLDNLEDEELLFQTVKQQYELLLLAVGETEATVVIVTNEVGAGIVPMNKLARHFRDLAGLANQAMAKEAAEVYLVVSGMAVNVKKLAENL